MAVFSSLNVKKTYYLVKKDTILFNFRKTAKLNFMDDN